MKKQSLGKLYGRLLVSAYDVLTGERVYRAQKRNQITNHGRIVVLDLLAQLPADTDPPTAQSNPEWNQIWSLSVGSSTEPAAASQETLVAPIPLLTVQLEIPVERAKVDANFEIQVVAEIPAGTGTGETFAEAGLFTRGRADGIYPADPESIYMTWESIEDRRMYARQTYPSFTKGVTMRVVYEWTLGMTISA
jgi:hypothetical protein